MPFNTPTPEQVASRIAAELETRLPGVDARSAHSVLAALARAEALGIHSLHLFGRWLADQMLPDTAEAEWLERHASLWGVLRRPASAAGGKILLTGVPGTSVPAGVQLSNNGMLAETLDSVVIGSGGTIEVGVAALEPGEAGNWLAGTRLTMSVPLAGIETGAIVVADDAGKGLTGGTDIEAEEVWRDRLIDRIQQPPHGGAASDYILWAQSVPGVAQVAVYPEQFGIGTVGVCFSVTGDTPVPSPEQVTAVRTYLEEVRPVTARLSVYGVTALPLDVSIELTPDSTALHTAVSAAVRAWFAADCTIGTTAFRSRLSEAISILPGEFAHRLLLPAADGLVTPPGHLLVPGVITVGEWAA